MSDELYKKLKKLNEYITKEQIFALYEQVLSEIESGKKDTGVWTKAYADSRGDLQAAKGIYIELMVERYVLAGEAQQEAINRNQKNKRKKELKKKIDTTTEGVKEYINESLAPAPKMKYDNLFGILAIIYSGLILFLTGYGEDWDFSRFSTSGVFGRVIFLIVVASVLASMTTFFLSTYDKKIQSIFKNKFKKPILNLYFFHYNNSFIWRYSKIHFDRISKIMANT